RHGDLKLGWQALVGPSVAVASGRRVRDRELVTAPIVDDLPPCPPRAARPLPLLFKKPPVGSAGLAHAPLVLRATKAPGEGLVAWSDPLPLISSKPSESALAPSNALAARSSRGCFIAPACRPSPAPLADGVSCGGSPRAADPRLPPHGRAQPGARRRAPQHR